MERISSFISRGFSKKSKRQSATAIRTHTCHLSKHPAYPDRGAVRATDWEVPEPEYNPVEFTHMAVLENDRTKKQNGWADPEVWTEALEQEVAQRVSNALEPDGKVTMVNHRPQNPMGRTGMIGRGLLGKYGPNYACDPLVTRFDPSTGNLQMVAVERGDTHQWAIPGGMVDAGESVSETLRREFNEECQNLSNEASQKAVREKLDHLFASEGKLVFVGYVDDPRNTDWAWMETVCVHFHIEDRVLAESMKLAAGDDAVKCRWLDVSDAEADFKNLYASHRAMVLRALQMQAARFNKALGKVAV